jgi:hypothetical protein
MFPMLYVFLSDFFLPVATHGHDASGLKEMDGSTTDRLGLLRLSATVTHITPRTRKNRGSSRLDQPQRCPEKDPVQSGTRSPSPKSAGY